MGLEKAIEHGKEHRKSYKNYDFAKYVSKCCRNHGGCPWCEGNRLNKYRNLDKISKKELKDFDK
jgi:excinuclease UvrABC ATPase subunit